MYETEFMKLYEELKQLNSLEEPKPSLQESSNKIIDRFNKPWYSGDFAGLNGISNKGPSPEELAKKAEEEEAKRRQKEKAEAIAAAKKVTTEDAAYSFNKKYRKQILQDEEYPVIDPTTIELLYDHAKKEELIQQTDKWFQEKREASALKSQQTRAANLAKAAATVMWYGYAIINGAQRKVAAKGMPEDADQAECIEAIKQIALKYLEEEAHECRVFGEPFKCSSKLAVTSKPYSGKEKRVDIISLK